MRFRKLAAMTGGLVLSISPFVHADAFDAKQIPADAKWMVHVDMDLLQKSKMWDIVNNRLHNQEKFVDGITKIEALTGAQFPKSVHDITIYGREAGDEAGVVMVNADVNRDKILGFLRMAPTYSSSTYGDYEIHAWEDKGKQLYGTFSAKGMMIIARSEKNIESALDVLDGKSDAMPADAAANGGAKTGVLAYIAGSQIAQLKKDKNPLVDQVDEGWISIGEDGTDLVVHSNLVAKSTKAANQLRSTLEGIKAFVTLASTAEDAEPRTKVAAAALENISATAKDKTVSVDGTLSEDLIKTVIENGIEGTVAPGAAKPAATPVPPPQP